MENTRRILPMTPVRPELLKAGKATAEVKREIMSKVRPGMKLIEICNFVEESIRSKEAEPAFPCNVCINDVAAHYTSTPYDNKIVGEGDVVKIDLGAHVNGFIADTATTLSFNAEYDDMVQAAQKVLGEALNVVRDGAKVSDIGKVISDGCAKRGYKPITNLSGHMMEQYQIHAGISIPNVWVAGTAVLKANRSYAVEPFLTTLDGAGRVIEGDSTTIFSLISRKKTEDRKLDDLMEQIWTRYRTLPFAARYFKDYSYGEMEKMITVLVRRRILHGYPILVEAKGKCVAQAEHTIVPQENGASIIT